MASTTPSGLLVGGDGDALMDEDTQLFLGPEVMMRLQLTGWRPRSPVSSIEDEPSRKRPQLIRSEAGNSIPTWNGSSNTSGSTEFRTRDPVPSVVGANNGSDASMEQLRALEKLAQQRVAKETDMRKADEAKAQYLLQVQRQLQESEAQTRQAELRKTHEVDAAQIRADYEAEL
ncbi:hypothetical protein PR003_g34374, partial [Phytophthora rubi]